MIRNGTLSLDALKRIVKQDYASGQKTPGSLARQEVIQNCENGQIIPLKLLDEPGLYHYILQKVLKKVSKNDVVNVIFNDSLNILKCIVLLWY